MPIKKIRYKQDYEISYEIVEFDGKVDIVFLHGWGARKEGLIKTFSKHLSGFRQIYIDLPGFGNSPLNHALTTQNYANIIKEFLKALESEPKIIVGHSFGGKVAALLKPELLVLLSSAGIQSKKRLSVVLRILIFKFFKMLGFGKFYRLFATKDVEGMPYYMYETLKNVVNEDYSDIFAKIKSRALIFWGEDDKTTPLKSGEKINRLIKNSELFALSGDHFFFLLHGKFISTVISREANQMFSANMNEKIEEKIEEDVKENKIENEEIIKNNEEDILLVDKEIRKNKKITKKTNKIINNQKNISHESKTQDLILKESKIETSNQSIFYEEKAKPEPNILDIKIEEKKEPIKTENNVKNANNQAKKQNRSKKRTTLNIKKINRKQTLLFDEDEND